VLLLEANRVIPVDHVVERVWAQRPPHRARNVLSGYVSRLRQVLSRADEVSIDRQPGGYVLSTDPGRST
jgi:DNA-binding SARP family transcriptional activator